MKLPAIQFYPADWRKDPGVQSLTFEERGIWFEIICLMHESEKRGVLLLNGKKMSNEQLSRILGLDNQILTKALTSLHDVGVSSIDPESGALMNRRMVRDEKLREIRRNCGFMGGNPVLVKQNTTTKDKQKSTPSSSSSSSSSVSTTVKKESSISRTFTDEWCKAWEEHHGAKYSFRPADGVAVANLLKIESDISKIMEIAKKAWSLSLRHDFERKHSIQLTSFVSQYNSIRLAVGDLQQNKDKKVWT